MLLSPREVDRVAYLADYDLVGSASENKFNEIAQLAAELFDACNGHVTIVGLAEVWTRGCAKGPPQSVLRMDAICAWTVLQTEPLIIPDLSKDDRFRHLPLVAGDPHLRFYAGTPVVTQDGLPLGTVCVIDTQPRDSTSALQRTALIGLARVVGAIMERRRGWNSVDTLIDNSSILADRALQMTETTLWQANSRGKITLVQIHSPFLEALTDAQPLRGAYINYVHPDDIGPLLNAWRHSIATCQPFDAEFRISYDQSDWRCFRARAALDRQARGDGSWYGTLEDVTSRYNVAARIEQLEAEVNHLSRVTAMGTMASALAHELNQPLTAVTNFVRAAQRLMPPETAASIDLSDALDGASEAALRAGSIVRSMRELVSRGDLQRRRTEVAPLVREACRIALADRANTVHLRISFDPAVEQIMVDPLQIQQVIINLARNAAEAMAESPGGRLLVRVRACDQDMCKISVGDTGPGLVPAIAAKLFVPFSTSKANGTGIGLSISRTIVEAHGGQMAATSRQTGGMLFSFTLPRC